MSNTASEHEHATIRVALDWTPNTLHSGLYLALTRNLYTAAHLTVHLIPPEPSYPTTPAKLLESGAADLAICPSESCIAYAESSKPNFHLQAIYAICQTDASAIVSMKGGKVEKISDLGKGKAGGGKYGSFNARYEDEIVRAMVEKDGGDGKGMQVVSHEGKLSLFDKVREGKGEVDATWVFLPWEGVIAEMAGEELNVFMLEQYVDAYGYSPVIARNASSTHLTASALRRFITATQKGYQLAVNASNTQAVVDALLPLCQPKQSEEFLERSLSALSPYYGTKAERLGVMDGERWEKWVRWLKERGLVKSEAVKAEHLWTNEFFQGA